jgi:predicted negative regulator of RcsB-dependent stress response
MSQQKNPTLLDSLQTEVAKEASPFLEFLIRNSRKIAVAAVLVVAVAVGISGWRLHGKNQLAEAREELGLILAKQSVNSSGLEELKTFAGRVEIEEVRTAAFLALASAANGAGDNALAASAWEEVSRLVQAGSPMYYTAQMGLAGTLDNQGRTAEALALLETSLDSAPAELTVAMNVAIADLAEKSGLRDKAVKAYEAMLDSAYADNDKKYLQQKIAYLQAKTE